MKRFRREIAIALATFFVVVSVSSHLLADRFFATVWPRSDERVDAVARDAVVLDPVTGRQLSGVTLHRRRSIVLRPPFIPDSTEVLVSSSTSTESGQVVSRRRWSALYRDRTGTAVDSPLSSEKIVRADASGNQVEVSRPLPAMRGQVIRFPRSTPARDLVRWDPETGRSTTARFAGRKKLQGNEVMVFRQRSTLREGQRRTTSVTTLWVRPEVGAVVRTSQDVLTTIGTGPSATVVLDATFVDDPADVRLLSRRVDSSVRAHQWFEAIGPALGLLTSSVAAAVALLGRNTRRIRG